MMEAILIIYQVYLFFLDDSPLKALWHPTLVFSICSPVLILDLLCCRPENFLPLLLVLDLLFHAFICIFFTIFLAFACHSVTKPMLHNLGFCFDITLPLDTNSCMGILLYNKSPQNLMASLMFNGRIIIIERFSVLGQL